MLAALVLNLLVGPAHAATTVGDILQQNPALSKYVTSTEDAANIKCLAYMSDVPSIDKFDEKTGAAIQWNITIPCTAQAVGVDAEQLFMTLYLKDGKPVLLSSELRAVPTR